MKKFKKLIKLFIPPVILKIYRKIAYIFLELKKSSKYPKFKYKANKELRLLCDSRINLFATKLDEFKISYNHSFSIKNKRLNIILDNYCKYQLTKCCLVVINNLKLDEFKKNQNNLTNSLAICCNSLMDIEILNKIGVKNLIYLPLKIGNHTDFDNCFKSSDDQINYYFLRLMLYLGIINYEFFYQNTWKLISLKSNKICMSLPESIERRKQFKILNRIHDFVFFPCLLHRVGWFGCALSYKTVASLCANLDYDNYIICEDDALFKQDYYLNINNILKIAYKENIDLINTFYTSSQNNKDENNNFAYSVNNIYIAKRYSTTGAVLNVYSKKFLKMIANYNELKIDFFHYSKFQMDQYTRRNSFKYNVFASYPQLVDHNTNLFSTINYAKNSDIKYDRSSAYASLDLYYLIKDNYEIR